MPPDTAFCERVNSPMPEGKSMSRQRQRALPKSPASLHAEQRGDLLVVKLNRAQKRNALNDETLARSGSVVRRPPKDVKCVVLHGDGDHFPQGSILTRNCGSPASRTACATHARGTASSDKMEFGRCRSSPCCMARRRRRPRTCGRDACARSPNARRFYALPEGVRGIFVGGGGSVRIPRLIGTSRMMDMMLTGHVLRAEEGQALSLSHYLVAGDRRGLAKAHRARHQDRHELAGSPTSRIITRCRASPSRIAPPAM